MKPIEYVPLTENLTGSPIQYNCCGSATAKNRNSAMAAATNEGQRTQISDLIWFYPKLNVLVDDLEAAIQ